MIKTTSNNLISKNFKINQLHLYAAFSKIGRRDLVLRNSLAHFSPILDALRVEWWNSTSRSVLTPELRNGNITLNKYFMSSSGDRTNNQSRVQSHFASLRD